MCNLIFFLTPALLRLLHKHLVKTSWYFKNQKIFLKTLYVSFNTFLEVTGIFFFKNLHIINNISYYCLKVYVLSFFFLEN